MFKTRWIKTVRNSFYTINIINFQEESNISANIAHLFLVDRKCWKQKTYFQDYIYMQISLVNRSSWSRCKGRSQRCSQTPSQINAATFPRSQMENLENCPKSTFRTLAVSSVPPPPPLNVFGGGREGELREKEGREKGWLDEITSKPDFQRVDVSFLLIPHKI